MRRDASHLPFRMKLAAAALLLLASTRAAAQTEYFNLDPSRPLRVQDAYAIERYGWDLQVGPAASGPSGSGSTWALETALAWGAFPRTQLEIAAPLASAPAPGGGHTTGLDGLELGALYNLNTETTSLPAFAVAAHITAPVGTLAPASALLMMEGIGTRSWSGLRVHLECGGDDRSARRRHRSAGAAPLVRRRRARSHVAAEFGARGRRDRGAAAARR